MRLPIAVLGLLPWLALPGQAEPPGLASAYEAALRRYASGDREGAVAAAAALDARTLDDQVDALRSLRDRARACGVCAESLAWRRAPVRVALMLHTDTWLRQAGAPRDAHAQEKAALQLARLLEQDPERQGFVRRWYGVMAGLAQGMNRWDEARSWIERGLSAFPGSAELLLARGAIDESMSAAEWSITQDIVDASPSETRRNLERVRDVRQRFSLASRTLREALAADPNLDEARLRLGRVAWRLGDLAAAREAFDDVLVRTKDRDTAYLAHLFSGRVHEQAGRLDEALRSYQGALALVPTAQAARLALSHVRLRLGDPAAARREAEVALAPADGRASPDPFWLYPWGAAARAEQRLEALRREVSS